VQEKNSLIAQYAARSLRMLPPGYDQHSETLQITRVEQILHAVNPQKIAKRASECESYARSVFHLEEHMRRLQNKNVDRQSQYRQLQQIYEKINEPDAIDGISFHLHDLDLSQQVLDYRRIGRYDAALSWYELEVQEDPQNLRFQADLLSCLVSAGRYGRFLLIVSL
jgi:serine/threonine-protein kinase ATR